MCIHEQYVTNNCIYLFIYLGATKLPASTDTTPTFEIIQETTNYRVFVLDVSGSMDVRVFERFSLCRIKIYLIMLF